MRGQAFVTFPSIELAHRALVRFSHITPTFSFIFAIAGLVLYYTFAKYCHEQASYHKNHNFILIFC